MVVDFKKYFSWFDRCKMNPIKNIPACLSWLYYIATKIECWEQM